MEHQSQGRRVRVRVIAILGFAMVALLLFGWALIEPWISANPWSARALSFLERPLLHVGELSLSLLFLAKAGAFLLFLGILAGQAQAIIRALLSRSAVIEQGQLYAIEKTAGYMVFVLGLLIGMHTSGINLSSLAFIGGALGIGIGLGFQESANNFLSGIILLFEQPIKVGDRVEVGNLDGDVVRIGSRTTWVRTNANITVIVPNSEFVTRQVINWTATQRQVRFDVPVGVSYKADPEVVRAVLLEIAVRNADVLAAPAPDVLFKGFGDSSLDFLLRVWTQTQVRTPNVLRSALYFAIFREFAQRGIEIPYPQRDLHLRSSDVKLGVELGTVQDAQTPKASATGE